MKLCQSNLVLEEEVLGRGSGRNIALLCVLVKQDWLCIEWNNNGRLDGGFALSK